CRRRSALEGRRKLPTDSTQSTGAEMTEFMQANVRDRAVSVNACHSFKALRFPNHLPVHNRQHHARLVYISRISRVDVPVQHHQIGELAGGDGPFDLFRELGVSGADRVGVHGFVNGELRSEERRVGKEWWE